MVVLARSNRSWKSNSCGVHGLEDVVDVYTSGDLQNENRSQAILSQLGVDTQEVDFNHLVLPLLCKLEE